MNTSCDGLPSDPALYEEEYRYWPWGRVLDLVETWVVEHAPVGVQVVDYMCGTGLLLRQIAARRPDLRCAGCSLTSDYISFGAERSCGVDLRVADAREVCLASTPEIVLCTAGVHHLREADQGPFLSKVASELSPGGRLILAEQVLAPYSNREERAQAVLDLGVATLQALLQASAPGRIIRTATDVLYADLVSAEWKIDEPRLLGLVPGELVLEQRYQTWPSPEGTSFGDVVFVFRKAESQHSKGG